MAETWDQMTERHKRERREMVEKLANKRITQTEAARLLGASLTCLNNYVQRNSICWPVVAQGQRKHTIAAE